MHNGLKILYLTCWSSAGRDVGSCSYGIPQFQVFFLKKMWRKDTTNKTIKFYSQQNLFSIHLEDHFSIQSLIVHEEEDMAHILRLTPIIPYTYREVP